MPFIATIAISIYIYLAIQSYRTKREMLKLMRRSVELQEKMLDRKTNYLSVDNAMDLGRRFSLDDDNHPDSLTDKGQGSSKPVFYHDDGGPGGHYP